jgi:hypothetical protein
MAHTEDAVVYDPTTGYVLMVVCPDDDSELDAEAFCGMPGQTTLPGGQPCAQQRVPPQGSVMGDIEKAQELNPDAHIQLPPSSNPTGPLS